MRREVYELRLTLEGIDPPIWRTVHIWDTTRLPALHRLIQIVFGWTGRQNHQFQAGGRSFGKRIRDPRFPPLHEDEARVAVRSILSRTGDEIKYVYEFQHEWTVRVEWTGTVLPVVETGYPCCISGARNAPPEEMGGAGAYAGWVSQQKRARRRPSFDPEYFSIEITNALLAASFNRSTRKIV